MVDIQEKVYQRTREHLRPRSQNEITPSAGNTSLPVGAVASVHNPKDTHITNDKAIRLPLLPEGRPKDSTPTPEQSTSKLPCSKKQVDLQPASTFAAGEKTCFQPKSQVTRTGRVTQVPARFKDRIETNRDLQKKLFVIDNWVHTDTHENVLVPLVI